MSANVDVNATVCLDGRERWTDCGMEKGTQTDIHRDSQTH